MGERPAVPDRSTYFRLWSELHGGYDPAAVRPARTWLGLAYRCGVPLASRGVAPDAVTAAGVLVAGLVLPPAAGGGRWLLVAAVLLVGSGLLDSLDGCVALLTGRTTRWGYVLDSVADRISDVLLVTALWLAGAPGGLCVAAAAVAGLQEYARARAGNAGLSAIGVVTVAERPTRIILGALGLAAAGVVPSHADAITTGAAAALLAVGVVGCGQLGVVIRRTLGSQAGPTSPATIRADNATSGSPPPGCAEPPTR